ncbi:MAG: hypothetical protein J0J01_22645 [Reyranella sp.]|uniref:hypothetical protein n=1 Tax=Reyranella sp. TaxID=1929291 RepID=UPI001AC1B07A|nr:hypothetical protein [Reyranella sp.]MBN9089720.1 hypothetical protein [Reyranella sp.]
MKRLLALLLLAATPAFAASAGEVTVLRGTAAPPTPWYEPPVPPPQPVVIYQPTIYPPLFYHVPRVVGPGRQHRSPDGWPLFRR